MSAQKLNVDVSYEFSVHSGLLADAYISRDAKNSARVAYENRYTLATKEDLMVKHYLDKYSSDPILNATGIVNQIAASVLFAADLEICGQPDDITRVSVKLKGDIEDTLYGRAVVLHDLIYINPQIFNSTGMVYESVITHEFGHILQHHSGIRYGEEEKYDWDISRAKSFGMRAFFEGGAELFSAYVLSNILHSNSGYDEKIDFVFKHIAATGGFDPDVLKNSAFAEKILDYDKIDSLLRNNWNGNVPAVYLEAAKIVLMKLHSEGLDLDKTVKFFFSKNIDPWEGYAKALGNAYKRHALEIALKQVQRLRQSTSEYD